MKKFLLATIGIILFINQTMAQNYEIQFAVLGEATTPDSVFVENLNQETELTIDGSDILFLTEGNGISSFNKFDHQRLVFYPNPIQENAYFEYSSDKQKSISISLYNTTGQILFHKKETIETGINQFEISGINKGSYALSVNDGLCISTVIIISQAETQTSPFIQWTGLSAASSDEQLETKSTKEMISMHYNDGESIRFTAHLENMTSVKQIIPISSQTIFFSNFSSAEAGLYLGIIAFNSDTYVKPLWGPCYTEQKPEYLNFIDSLEMGTNTLLYHSVDMALNIFETAELPIDINNASIITFTDGLDQGSWMLHASEYSNENEMLNSIHNRILNQTVNDINISAYTIGLLGEDISDQTLFQTNLSQLSSSTDNVFSVDSIEQVNSTFQLIADSMNQISITNKQTIRITIPGESPGTTIRITLDAQTEDANNSNMYIQGDFALNDGVFSLENIIYEGLTSISGNSLIGTPNGSINLDFEFTEVSASNGAIINNSDINQWKLVGTDTWQINSEFDQSVNTQTETQTIRNSAAIILVLDCSSSLGGMFPDVQIAGKNFIEIILDEIGPNPNIATSFYADNITVFENDSVHFYDQSSNNPTSWLWNFGDGTTSNEQNPAHAYETAGQYTVSLTASNSTSSDTDTIIDYITVGSLENCGIVIDYDGNEYNTVQIGDQCWMRENLKTTHLNNGTALDYTPDYEEWDEYSYGSHKYCYPNNDTLNKDIYGVLYTFSCVATEQLCPEGWHVPDNTEIEELIAYLGGTEIAGGKLKESGSAHWGDPNTGATNESGFTALPAGHRQYYGAFQNTSYGTSFWSSSGSTSTFWAFSLQYNTSELSFGYQYVYPASGKSVRCIKDSSIK